MATDGHLLASASKGFVVRILWFLLTISCAVAGSTVTARAASMPATRTFPVVATYVSNLSPKVGQRETVSVQFYLYHQSRRFQYLSGARLSVSLQLGKKVLKIVIGSKTNKQGKASAHFTVPKQAAGKWLWVFTRLKYKGKLYGGSNRVRIAKS